MKRLILALGLLLGWVALAQAQVPCVGVGGVNSVPQTGVTCAQEPSTNSYAATGIALVPASTATDIACLTGSASKVSRLQSVTISGSAGTLINVPVTIRKNASADTAGTPATSTALPVPYALDSTDLAPSATTIAYTANPTINDTTPGLIANGVLVLAATGTLAGSNGLMFDWSSRNFVEAPTLRGVAQQLCVNLNSTSVSSGVLSVTFRWTEAAQ